MKILMRLYCAPNFFSGAKLVRWYGVFEINKVLENLWQ